MQNAKKSAKNIIASLLNQFSVIALGVIIPRLILVNLGSETNGLLSSINSVLVYMSLLEGGVGAAALQALYGPVAEGDKNHINSILSATAHFYNRAATWYLVIVLLLTFFYPLTLQTELPRWQVMLTLLFSGLPSVLNYYLQSKYTILLQAEGKRYITISLATVVHIFASLSRIALLLNGFGIVELQMMYFAYSVVENLFIIGYIRRNYRWLKLKVAPDHEAIAQSKNALVHQVSVLILNNLDVLLLTWFCGLRTVSVYSMYYLVFSMVDQFIGHISGVTFALGQAYNKNRPYFAKLLDAYEVCYITLTFSLHCIANLFIIPFLELYTAGVVDIDYINLYLPYLFIAVYTISKARVAAQQAIMIAGHFKQTQGQAICESLINIVVSLVAVIRFGIYGVLIGTIVAMLYRANVMILYAYKKILCCGSWRAYRRWLVNLAVFIVITIWAKRLLSYVMLSSYWELVVWAALATAVIVPLFFVIAVLFDRRTFSFIWELVAPYLCGWNKKHN